MQRLKKMRGLVLVLVTVVALSLVARSRAGTEENADDFMQLETSKNLAVLMGL